MREVSGQEILLRLHQKNRTRVFESSQLVSQNIQLRKFITSRAAEGYAADANIGAGNAVDDGANRPIFWPGAKIVGVGGNFVLKQ